MPKPRKFVEFKLAKKRERCKVCHLPPEVVKQLKGRSKYRMPVGLVLEWLATDWGIKITRADWGRHHRERHSVGLLAAKNR